MYLTLMIALFSQTESIYQCINSDPIIVINTNIGEIEFYIPIDTKDNEDGYYAIHKTIENKYFDGLNIYSLSENWNEYIVFGNIEIDDDDIISIRAKLLIGESGRVYLGRSLYGKSDFDSSTFHYWMHESHEERIFCSGKTARPIDGFYPICVPAWASKNNKESIAIIKNVYIKRQYTPCGYMAKLWNKQKKKEELKNALSIFHNGVGETNESVAKLIRKIGDAIIENTNTKIDIRTLNRIAMSVMDQSYNHDMSISAILAQIKVESDFNYKAVSADGAEGLMQIAPSIKEYLIVKMKNPSLDAFDIADNIAMGCNYMAEQIAVFGNWETALKAYNASSGTVETEKYVSDAIKWRYIFERYGIGW